MQEVFSCLDCDLDRGAIRVCLANSIYEQICCDWTGHIAAGIFNGASVSRNDLETPFHNRFQAQAEGKCVDRGRQ